MDGIKPKSIDLLVLLSVSSSFVGSEFLTNWKVSDMTIVPICVPSSSLLIFPSVIAPGSNVGPPVPVVPAPFELTYPAGIPLLSLTK